MIPSTSAWRSIVIWPSWAICAAVIALQAFGGPPSSVWIYVPFAASVILFGLPHGALDHLVLLRQRNERPALRALSRIVAEYLSLAALTLGLWFVAPGLTFALFIALTWFHWGQGDLHSLLRLQGVSHLNTRWQRVLTLVVRGGLPMFVPLIAFPEVYEEVALAIIEWFEPQAGLAVGWIASEAFRIGGAIVFGSIATTSLIVGWMRSRENHSGWIVDAGETVLLAIFFALVHPVMAIGLYFCFWHATRHFARLIETDPFTHALSRKGSWKQIVWTLAGRAAPTTLAAVAIGFAIYALAPLQPEGRFVLLGIYLVVIKVRNFPQHGV